MNTFEIAAKMEQEAIAFYRQCAEKTANPVGKKMFLSIVEDEQYHFECAVSMKESVRQFTPPATTPLEDMKKIFDEHKQEMLVKVPSTADELEALKVAMKMEEEAIAFYKKASALAANAKEKHFFDCLIKDEEEHFHVFQNTYSFLEDSGNWFMWEEKGIVEG
jgi:rubrerythrin